jgi:cysteine-rich repeat protein/parallel beta-helix repeat protein
MKDKRELKNLNKRGSIALVGIVVFLVLAFSTSIYLSTNNSSPTGALIGINTIGGECNISVRESVSNIGHDYECQNSDGFQIDADNIVLDCQDHYIKCVSDCNDTSGIRISNHTNITIQNCYVYNFTDGIRLESNSANNFLTSNYLYNNTNGVTIHNSTSNNVTRNYVDYNRECGVNLSGMDHLSGQASSYNRVWDNKIWNSSGGQEACNDAGSYNYWYLGKACGAGYENIYLIETGTGSNCTAGNWWLSYSGKDNDGDGFGDSGEVPYHGGGIDAGVQGDHYPIVDPCGIPGVIGENITCGSGIKTSDSGEGLAIIESGKTFICNGTMYDGNGSAQTPPYADDMRGLEIVNVHDVTVRDCTFYNFTYGVYIKSAYNIVLDNITIVDNNYTGIYIGSLAYNITVKNSLIANKNTQMQQYGIRMLGTYPNDASKSNNIYTNIIQNHTVAGIYLEGGSDNNYIYSNDLYNNTDGIIINNSDGTNVYNNDIHNNTGKAILVENSVMDYTGNSSLPNDVYGNLYGYYLDSTASMTSGNYFSGNAYDNTYGVYSNGFDGNFQYLTLYDNTYNAVINNSNTDSYLKISNVTVYGGTYGILAENSLRLSLAEDGDVNIYNNTQGVYFLNTNSSRFSPSVDPSVGEDFPKIHNNTNNVVLDNSYNNQIEDFEIYGGTIGINLTTSDNNNVTGCNVSYLSAYNIYLNDSDSNLVYNNIIDNTTGGVAAYDNGSNNWNTSLVIGTSNILGGSMGGNYWESFDVSDNDGDGIGDTANYSISGGSNFDYLPLTRIFVGCGNISSSISLNSNVNVNGSCFIIKANNLTINFNGYTLTGNGMGIGINVTDYQGIKVIGAQISNFSTAIHLENTTSTNYHNITNATLSSSTTGISITDVNNAYIYFNTIHTNNLGLSISGSYNNTIYNNNFTNTVNLDESSGGNYWNVSYNCSATNNSIVNSECSGGNYWHNYLGRDTGGGTYPYNDTNDGIGDTNIPYSTGMNSSGDYLPLTLDDGSVSDSSCLTITTSTILSNDISCNTGDGITISGNDLTLDCNNNNINGGGLGAGISIDGKSNVIIKRCNVTNFYYGIKALNTNNLQVIENNNLELNDFYGIYLYNSATTTINNNNIINDNNGIYSISSSGTTIYNNTINLQKKFYGIYLFNSQTNNITDNTLWDNYHGIYLVNSSATTANNNNITLSDVYSLFVHKGTTNSYFNHNTLSLAEEGIRIRKDSSSNYFSNNTLIDHTNYGVYLIDSSSNQFINNTITNNTVNVYVSNGTITTLNNNSVSGASTGVNVINSDNLTLHLNTINGTNSPSLEINGSDYCNLTNNTIQNNLNLNNDDQAGLYYNLIIDTLKAVSSDYLTVDNNNITANFNLSTGNYLTFSNNTLVNAYITSSYYSTIDTNTLKQLSLIDFGTSSIISNNDVDDVNGVAFSLNNVDGTNIYSNNIQNSTTAILLNGSSTDNIVYDNWIKDNTVGINVSSSSSNKFYNNYFENTNNVYDDIGNLWNTSYSCSTPNIVGGPCQGGNFYSNYYGLDNGDNNGEQGDGIGDNPNSYTVSSSLSAYDYLPLVLYVARVYYHPDYYSDSIGNTTFAWGNVSGSLTDQEIVPNQAQLINFTYGGTVYLELQANFNQSNVDLSTLKLTKDVNKTAINKTGITSIASDYSLYLHHNNQFDAGAYLCPEVYDLSLANSTCTGRINLTTIGTTNGIILSQSGTYYKISNLTNQSSTVVLNNGASSCGSNILHDVTFSSDLSCTGAVALTIAADNLTIDMAGYSLTGPGSGIGINISDKEGVNIINANVINFSTGIYVDPSSGINLTGNNITNNSIGISFIDTNHSFIVSNRIYNNTLGLNLTGSYNNTIYNNFFNNTNNTNEQDHNNTWNISLTLLSSGTNIIGGSYLGGNYWHDYTGWDTDLEGIGETQLPYNNSGNLTGGDYLPLTEVGKIECGGTTTSVTTNITLNQNLTASSTCFMVNTGNIIIDCNNYYVTGAGSGNGIEIQSSNQITLQDCYLLNFSNGLFMNDSNHSTVTGTTLRNNSYGLFMNPSDNNTFTSNTLYDNGNNTYVLNSSLNNFTGNTFNSSNYALMLFNSDNNTFVSNYILNNSYGMNLSNSGNNTIYDNKFNNTNNSIADLENFWNVSNQSGVNIIGGAVVGGNYWSNYNGSDNGNAIVIGLPNASGDGFGDTLIPYNNSDAIAIGGDYLPLTDGATCGDNNITGAEECDDGNTDWGDTCSPTCTSTYDCSDNIDNDGDGLNDTNDTGCHTDYNATNSSSYNASKDSETYCGDSVCESGESCSSCSADCGACSVDTPSGGGGSGGSGGSGRITTTEEVNCTQSWQCNEWSECIGERETRNCNDVNTCNTLESAGDVTNVIKRTKPIESRSCEMSSSSSGTGQSGSSEIGSKGLVDRMIPDEGIGRTITLSSLALVAILGGVSVYWYFGYAPTRIRRRLRKIDPILGEESADVMKDGYKGIYRLYLKLSESKKQNFYSKVTKVREKIEEQLKAEKKIEELFHKTNDGVLKDRKRNYLEIYKNYRRLPAKTQQKYYQKIVHLRNELETEK